MVVEATCCDCGDVHPVGDRRLNGVATRCPACESPRYASHSTDGQITKTERERIADAVGAVDGVGELTLANIQARFSTYVELEAADRAQLLAIDGVGPMAANGILKRV